MSCDAALSDSVSKKNFDAACKVPIAAASIFNEQQLQDRSDAGYFVRHEVQPTDSYLQLRFVRPDDLPSGIPTRKRASIMFCANN